MNTTTQPKIVIRPALPTDAGQYLKLVEAFAEFESLPAPDAEAKTRLIDHLFRDRPAYRLLVAELDGRIVAYAAHFLTYSTFRARPTFLLEDIFVLPEHRHHRIGHRLFVFCAKTAVAEGCARMDFQVLDWNKDAISFYKSHGVDCLREWLLHRVQGQQLLELSEMDVS